MALGDAILVCLTERPMTGYELAKTFDSSIGFFWKADHQQIYRELTRLRERRHVQAREVVQSGKPNKLVYTLTTEGKAALRHWAARPSSPPSIKDDMLVRLCALEAIDMEPLRTDLMARLEHHRDRLARYERVLKKRFPHGAASLDDTGKLLAELPSLLLDLRAVLVTGARDLLLARQPQLAQGAGDGGEAARGAEVPATLIQRGIGPVSDELAEPLEVLGREHRRVASAVGPGLDRAGGAVELQQPSDEGDADEEPLGDLFHGRAPAPNRIDDPLSEILGIGCHRSPPHQDLHSNGAPSK